MTDLWNSNLHNLHYHLLLVICNDYDIAQHKTSQVFFQELNKQYWGILQTHHYRIIILFLTSAIDKLYGFSIFRENSTFFVVHAEKKKHDSQVHFWFLERINSKYWKVIMYLAVLIIMLVVCPILLTQLLYRPIRDMLLSLWSYCNPTRQCASVVIALHFVVLFTVFLSAKTLTDRCFLWLTRKRWNVLQIVHFIWIYFFLCIFGSKNPACSRYRLDFLAYSLYTSL